MASERLNAAIAEMAKQDITFANCDSSWQKRVMTAVLAAADTRPALIEGVHTLDELMKDAVKACKALTPEQQLELMEEQRKFFVENNVALSRPAPAATDTGLVTAMTVRVEDAGDAGITAQVDDLITDERGLLELVTRSQAVELLSEKDVIIRSHLATIATLNSDNTALAAQNKRLDDYAREATKALTGLSGGGSENFGKPIGELYPADLTFCVERIRERIGSKRDRLRNEITTKRKIDAALYNISEIEGCAGEFIQTPCRSLKDRLLQAINRARVALEDDKDGSGGGLRG